MIAPQTSLARESETVAQRDARMKWFTDARFGMFIHWGVYSVPAGKWEGKTDYGEWIMDSAKIPMSRYEQFAKEFNPTKFDAKQWAALAKRAGMKYVVITSKHHDGFAMYNSKVSEWDIINTPYARDPMKDLSAACREVGVKFCFYHSIMDWHHPDYAPRRAWNDVANKDTARAPDYDRYVEFMKAQLKELLTNYGPIGILWFDGEWEDTWTDAHGQDLYDYVRSLQPAIIVNNRVAKSRGGMAGMSKGEKDGDRAVGDYGTPEQQIPATGFPPGVYWESCMTMNGHWGHNARDTNFKSTQTLLQMLIDCASKGGNFLLNVGPTREGLIPPESVQRLEEIGRWLDINGEAIYGTSASPFRKLKWGRATRKGNTIYLHVFSWPVSGSLLVPLRNMPSGATVMGMPNVRVEMERADEAGLSISFPQDATDTRERDSGDMPVVVRIELRDPPDVIIPDPTIRPAADGAITCLAEDAEKYGESVRIETLGGVPSVGFWTDKDDFVMWPAVRFDKPGTYELVLDYACEPESGGSEIIAQVGAQKLGARIVATNGWSDFKTMSLGTLKIAEATTVEVKLAAITKPGLGVMNLRSLRVVLRPD